MGTEQGVIKCLELLAEDNEMLRQEMTQIITTVDKMADIIANIATVGQKLKQDWEKVRQSMHPQNEAGEDIKQ